MSTGMSTNTCEKQKLNPATGVLVWVSQFVDQPPAFLASLNFEIRFATINTDIPVTSS